MKNILLPSEVITKVESYISENYPTVTTKSRIKLFKTLLDLWFYIYTRHNTITTAENFKRDTGVLKYWCNISSDKLKSFRIKIDKFLLIHSALLEILEKAQVIEINSSYSTNNTVNKSFTKAYRPHHKLCYDKTTFVDIKLDSFMKDFKTKSQLIRNNKNYKRLINSIYETHINLDEFFKELDLLLGKSYNLKKPEQILTPQISYKYKIIAIKVNLGAHFFSISSEGRAYTSIANLPSIMIPFLTLKGKKVQELDAANSQPLLLSSIVNCSSYKKDVEDGVFYERMAEELGMTRQEFKIMSYKKIFFNNEQITKPLIISLDKIYPGLATQINNIKKETPLWAILQNLESEIWINVANNCLYPVLTRHDSVLVWSENINNIKELLIQEYTKRNLKVTLK